jgi:citrate synthase
MAPFSAAQASVRDMSNTNKGLEGVVIGQTTISQVLGEAGQLIYGGYRIEDLAANTTFEEVCHLLWYGDLPDARQLGALRERFADNMVIDDATLDVVRAVAARSHPMAALRTAISALAAADPDAEDMSPEANDRKAVRLTAQVITLTAAIERVRRSEDPIAPRRDLGLAANLLYMMHGGDPDDLSERIIDASLILHAEHGMNASTFSARVTASTLADMHSAVTSAIGTLKGTLHGGANERVMQMLLRIERPENAAQWVRDALGRGEKIMGFGHRVYRTLDPRAPILKTLAEQLLGRGGDTRWLEISEIIQSTMREEMDRKGKKIYPNVDFFSASVYYTLGIPLDLFTNLFACARMSGWTAHVIEQLKDNRLIRPKAEYTGPSDRTVTAVAQRA